MRSRPASWTRPFQWGFALASIVCADLASARETVLVRVGLATDRDTVSLCCDANVRVALADRTLTLERPVTIEPDAALGGRATYRLQVAALKDEQQAERLAAFLRREIGQPADVVFDAGRDLYRVRVGRFARPDEAEAAKGRLTAIGVEQGFVVSEGGTLERAAMRIEQGGQSWRVDGRWLRIDAPPDAGVPFDKGRYRRQLAIYLNDRGHLNVINVLPLESYLRGVVPREMGPELYNQLEALKAQTVAARTFTVRNLGEFEQEGYDICSTPRCQVYGGMKVEHPLSDRAIRETAGQVVLQDAEPAEVFYSATCGGHTENVHVVFPDKRGSHLIGVPCLEGGSTELPRPTTAPAHPFPHSVMRQLLPPAPGRPEQVLAARLEHLALLGGLRVPHDRLRSVAAGEVRRYLRSVLDLVIDPRLLGDGSQLTTLLDAPPASWRPADVALGRWLTGSGLLAHPDDRILADHDIEPLLYALARYLDVLRSERASFHAHADAGLTVRRGALWSPDIETLVLPRRLATYQRRGTQLLESGLELMPGDPLELLWHRERLLAVIDSRPGAAVEIGKRNARGFWRKTKSRGALVESVQARYPGFPFTGFQVLSRGSSQRVGKLRLLGSDGRSLLVEGLAVRWTLDLPDTWFHARAQGDPERPDAWTFEGRGWGHGVGMCQAGAFGMAMRGATYREILSHYFTGIRLGRLTVGGVDPEATRSAATEAALQ